MINGNVFRVQNCHVSRKNIIIRRNPTAIRLLVLHSFNPTEVEHWLIQNNTKLTLKDMKIPSRRRRKQRKKSINQRLLLIDLEIFLFLIQSNILQHIFIYPLLIDHSIELLLFIAKIYFKMIRDGMSITGRIDQWIFVSLSELSRDREKKKNKTISFRQIFRWHCLVPFHSCYSLDRI